MLLYMRIYALDSHILHTNEPNLESIAQNPQWKALLHYRGNSSLIPKDSIFFLSKNGYKNPLDELKATLTLLDSKNEQEQFFCRYPARAKFLATFFPHIESVKPQILCEAHDEFRIIVPDDSISLVFAAESDIYPGSGLGHIYLALQGRAKQDFYKAFSEREVLDVRKGQEIGYSISFFANTELGLNPFAYIKALSGNLAGIYALMPLENSIFEYVDNEKRSLYWLELKLDSTQKDMLLAHLWELKDVPLDYAFATHNCNDAMQSVLSVANLAYDVHHFKPYQTPIEYIKALHRAGLIIDMQTTIPTKKESFVKRYGKNDIFHARDSTKIAFEYESVPISYTSNNANSTESTRDSVLGLYFAPIYSDITSVNNAYAELIESRLLSVDLRFNARNNRAFVRQIEALHLFSIADTFRTKTLAKYIDISFSNPFYENTRTALKPHITFGVGLGGYIGNISIFALPLFGYEYIGGHNGFIDMRFGAVLRWHKVRFMGSFDYYFDIDNKRGYTHDFQGFMGVNLYKQMDMYMKVHLYRGISDFVGLVANDYLAFSIGLSTHF